MDDLSEGMEALTAMSKAYLERMNFTLWGESFNIKTPDGLERASRWLAAQCLGMADMYDPDA